MGTDGVKGGKKSRKGQNGQTKTMWLVGWSVWGMGAVSRCIHVRVVTIFRPRCTMKAQQQSNIPTKGLKQFPSSTTIMIIFFWDCATWHNFQVFCLSLRNPWEKECRLCARCAWTHTLFFCETALFCLCPHILFSPARCIATIYNHKKQMCVSCWLCSVWIAQQILHTHAHTQCFSSSSCVTTLLSFRVDNVVVVVVVMLGSIKTPHLPI